MPTFGSLFAGIGGMDLGLERAGWTCRWQVEIDPFCQRVLAKHWPEVPRFGDIRALTGAELELVDLIAGGFPCQPVSQAGRRRAQADERWLWPDFFRLILMVRPSVVLVENVPGLLDRGMGDVLGDLASIGFHAEWNVLGADAFGATQHRERVWILANAHHARLQGRIWTGESYPQGQPDAATHREPLRSTCGLWPPGPGAVDDIPRMADGPADRMDRMRALGNAVVPQVAEWIGRRLLAVMEAP